MNRYTALYRPGSDEATPARLRKALETALAESLPKGSYRLGAIEAVEAGRVAAELACRLPKAELGGLVEAASAAAGFTLDQVGWGWVLSGRMTFELVDETSGELLHDPLGDETPQAEAQRSYRYGWQQIAGLAIVLLAAGIALVLALGYLLSPTVAAWVSEHLVNLALGVILVWMILRLIGAIVTPWNYLRAIEVDEAGITLQGLLQPAVKAAWQEIGELQYVDQRGILLAGERILTFSLRDKLGMKDRLALLRTIIQRAELLFVGGKVGEITYRKFDT